MNLELTKDQSELILFCLEQMEVGFNDYEQELCHQLFATLTNDNSTSNNKHQDQDHFEPVTR